MPVYTARLDATSVSSAATLVQLNAPSNAALKILRAWASVCTVTSCALQVRLTRRTTAGTGTAFTPIRHDSFESSTSATATVNHSAEGTAGDVIIRDTFNVLNGYLYLPVPEERILNGYLYLPVPEERIVVPPGCALSLDLPVAPFNASSLNAGITWSERE